MLFQLFDKAMSAWAQAGMLLVGGLATGIGLLILASRLRWRLLGVRVVGTLRGVRETRKGVYRRVYRYKLADGKTHEATADRGSASLDALSTGRKVRLLVFKRRPERAMEWDDFLLDIVGAASTVLGSTLVAVAVILWPVTLWTGAVVALFGVFLIRGFHKVRPGSELPPAATLIFRRPPPESLQTIPIQRVEAIFADPVRVAKERRQQQWARLVSPSLVIIGLAVLALGVHLGRTIIYLSAHGRRTDGAVIELQLRRTTRSSAYYPLVRFVTRQGHIVQFYDGTGSQPPSYHEGDRVPVLYLEGAPEQSAMIDHGWKNGLPPVALCLFGTILATVALHIRPRLKTRSGALEGSGGRSRSPSRASTPRRR